MTIEKYIVGPEPDKTVKKCGDRGYEVAVIESKSGAVKKKMEGNGCREKKRTIEKKNSS